MLLTPDKILTTTLHSSKTDVVCHSVPIHPPAYKYMLPVHFNNMKILKATSAHFSQYHIQDSTHVDAQNLENLIAKL